MDLVHYMTFKLHLDYLENSSLGPAPRRNFTHFLKIGLEVTGGVFYSYYIHQGKKSDKEMKIVRKKLSFMQNKKDLMQYLKDGCNSVWVQFHVYP